jgi:hypothetical protein
MSNKAESATFIIRERGTAAAPHLSVEFNFSWNEDFKAAFKRAVPHGAGRVWDEDLSKWFISPDWIEKTAELAFDYFKRVYKVEGTATTDLRTGDRMPEQADLFG